MGLLKTIHEMVNRIKIEGDDSSLKNLTESAKMKCAQSEIEKAVINELTPVGKIDCFEWMIFVDKWIDEVLESEGQPKDDKTGRVSALCVVIQDIIWQYKIIKEEDLKLYDITTTLLVKNYFDLIKNNINNINLENTLLFLSNNKELLENDKILVICFFDLLEDKVKDLSEGL